LTARPTRRAGTKVGLSDPTVPSGRAVAQRIKVTLGITFIRWATPLPLAGAGSLVPTFVPVWPVGLTVKLPCALTLNTWLPTRLREPLSASVTFWEATAPVKLPARHCP